MKYPEFRWSFSKHKTLMTCQAKYYKQYYQSHNGWREDTSALGRHTYRLKNLTTLEIEVGNKVHQFIEEVFMNSYQPGIHTEEEMFCSIWNEIMVLVETSLHHPEVWYEDPRNKMLFEAYYNSEIPDSKLEETKERLKQIVQNFFQSDTFREVTQNHYPVWKTSEKFRHMMNGNIKVQIKMDLLYSDKKTKVVHLVDWKTGKIREEDRYQLALYSHYISHAFKRDLSQIKLVNEYLLDNQRKDYQLQQIDIQNMREVVANSISYMQSFLEVPDSNVPLDQSFFEQTANEQVCVFCSFKEICKKV
ncbi:PD-(D/E)XK nuclease family protein [Neobacillus drentensis]|uniref:PD-(D/E)XK nuclease family protein n=1 Tax=Neobacillus drentensis TaxID=220684 RepID=UPI002FFEBE7F